MYGRPKPSNPLICDLYLYKFIPQLELPDCMPSTDYTTSAMIIGNVSFYGWLSRCLLRSAFTDGSNALQGFKFKTSGSFNT